MQKLENLIGNISVRGRGYYEAVMKIAEGQKLIEAGTLELAQLDGRAPGARRRSLSGDGGVEVTRSVSLLKKKAAPKPKKPKKPVKNDRSALYAKLKAGAQADVLRYLRTHGGVSIGKIMRGTKRSFYTVQDALKALADNKKIRSITVTRPTGGTVKAWELINAG